MEQAKVYITKFQPDWDFGPAAEYGEVVFLTEDEMKPEPTIGGYNERVEKEMRTALDGYVSGVDYVVMTASATNNFKAANILYKKGHLHNVLRWNGRKHKYELYKI